MITYHGYNNGYKNPMYNVHKNAGMHYTWQNTVAWSHGEISLDHKIEEGVKHLSWGC